MTVTRAVIRNLLLPVLNKVKGEYKLQPDQWKDIYKQAPSKMAVERIAQMQYSGFAGTKPEARAMNQDPGFKEKYVTEFLNQSYGLSVLISREALDDNQYKQDFPRIAENLRLSGSSTKNTVAGMFLTDGFTATVADGQPLFSTAHPYEGGVFSNKLSAALNETSANAAMILANNFKTEAGLPISAMLETLVVAPENIFAAERLTKSVFAPDNANNSINPVYTTGLFSKGYKKNNFINPTSAANSKWFVTTNIPGMCMFQRIPAEFDVNMDTMGTTKTLVTTYYERYSFGCHDPRSIIGSTGA